MKLCFKCGVEKDRSEFYAHPQMADGLLGKCKECAKRDVRENRASKIDYYRKFDRNRAMLPHRVLARAEYAKTDAGRESMRKAGSKYSRDHPWVKSEWARKNPRKRAAHVIFGNAVRSGKVVRQPCERCGAIRSHGHHENYDEPLKVVWLCPQHHMDRHKEMRELGLVP